MKGTTYQEVQVDYASEWRVPVKNRTSTDQPFLISFLVFLALWIAIGAYAITAGDIKVLGPDNNNQFSDEVVETKGVVLGLIAGSIIMCLIYVCLLRWFTLPLVIVSATILTAVYGYLAYYFFTLYTYHKNHKVNSGSKDGNKSGYLTGTIIFAIMAIIIPIVIVCNFKRIKMACQLIQEGSRAVMCIYTSLMFPILKVILHFIAIVYSIIVALHLASIEKLNENVYAVLMTIHVAGFIWVYCFITALGEIILAYAFATWYWTFDKLQVPSFTIAKGARKVIRYHLGTVAFGSLIITICRLIRILLDSLKSNERCGAFLISCGQFIMRHVENFLKYMNRNAYIVCALYGKGLYGSATVAMDLIVRNAFRTITLTNVVSWVLWSAKIFISVAMGLLALWHYHDENDEKKYWMVPVWMVIIGTYLVTNVFFSVYVIAIDTIYICFLEDCEHHDGSSLKPYYMSRKLRTLLYKEEESE